MYKGALYLTVELYLYSPYGPYGLYRASVPVQGCTLPLPYQILKKLEFSPHILEKYSNVKLHENPSRGSRAVPCGQREGRTGRQIDMRKLMVAFATLRTRLKMADLCGKIIPDYTAPYKKQ
jgi:hypothetical protein